MHVHDFRELGDDGLQAPFQAAISYHFISAFNRRRFAFDVSQDGGDFRYIPPNLRFQERYPVVSLQQSKPLIQLQMLFDVKTPTQILHADIVHIEIVPRRHGPNAVEDVLAVQSPRDRVHDDVGVGQNAVDRNCDRVHHLFGALESDIARQTNRQVGKIPVSRSPDADAIYFQHSVHFGNRSDDLGTHSGGSGIQ